MNILDTEISYYPNRNCQTWLQTVNLYEYLTKPTAEQIAQVQAIRACPDADQQKEMKSKVPCITPSGVFSPLRNASSLVRHSGIITLDFDADANPGVNFADLKAEVHRLNYVAACMYSIRGQGLVLYIPIKYPEHHKAHFERLAEDFAGLGLKVDPLCKDVCRLRYDTYDAEPYFNLSAQVYERLKAAPVPAKRNTYTYAHQPGDVFSWAVSCVERAGIHFVQGTRHEFIYRLSALLNKAGVSETDTRAYVHTRLLPESEIKTNCISGPYKLYASEHGTLDYRAGGASTSTARPIRYVTHRTDQSKAEDIEVSANLPEPTPEPPAQSLESDQVQLPGDRVPAEVKGPLKVRDLPDRITSLQTFFDQHEITGLTLELSPGVKISDLHKFIEGHLSFVKAHPKHHSYAPYLERLESVRALLQT